MNMRDGRQGAVGSKSRVYVSGVLEYKEEMMARYIHKWHIPIKVVVFSVAENWYYAPWYNPKHVPVAILRSGLSMKMNGGTNEQKPATIS